MSLGKNAKHAAIFTKYRRRERSYSPKDNWSTLTLCGMWLSIYEVTIKKTYLETAKITVSAWPWDWEIIEVLKYWTNFMKQDHRPQGTLTPRTAYPWGIFHSCKKPKKKTLTWKFYLPRQHPDQKVPRRINGLIRPSCDPVISASRWQILLTNTQEIWNIGLFFAYFGNFQLYYCCSTYRWVSIFCMLWEQKRHGIRSVMYPPLKKKRGGRSFWW